MGLSVGSTTGTAMPSLHASQFPRLQHPRRDLETLPRASVCVFRSPSASRLWSRSASLSCCRWLTSNVCLFDVASTGCRCPRRYSLTVRSANIGEFGARDPTAAEIASNFGDKVVGNEGTEHVKLIPSSSLLGLAERSCKPLPPATTAMSEDEARSLLRKLVGWRLEKADAGLKIWTEWKMMDAEVAKTLFDRIAAVAEAEEHFPECSLQEKTNVARAELSTPSIGGLSINDFICAAKIDRVKSSDLVKKNRFWA